MIEKYESRRIRREIRRVLLEVWDPIGVKNAPSAQDEYDGYLGQIFLLLTEGKSDDEIVSYLFWVVSENMGLSSAKASDMLPTVKVLRQIQIAQPS